MTYVKIYFLYSYLIHTCYVFDILIIIRSFSIWSILFGEPCIHICSWYMACHLTNPGEGSVIHSRSGKIDPHRFFLYPPTYPFCSFLAFQLDLVKPYNYLVSCQLPTAINCYRIFYIYKLFFLK